MARARPPSSRRRRRGLADGRCLFASMKWMGNGGNDGGAPVVAKEKHAARFITPVARSRKREKCIWGSLSKRNPAPSTASTHLPLWTLGSLKRPSAAAESATISRPRSSGLKRRRAFATAAPRTAGSAKYERKRDKTTMSKLPEGKRSSLPASTARVELGKSTSAEQPGGPTSSSKKSQANTVECAGARSKAVTSKREACSKPK
mmetsp:Transcript_13808/g.37441  ORF Transcript_13808/g.37441 Transcript_13808/m.37441 type:complete len:204 (+) Transcript_13808:8-619(+)